MSTRTSVLEHHRGRVHRSAYMPVPQTEQGAGATPNDKVMRLLESTVFQAFMGVQIVLNALCIGLEIDMPEALPWDFIETIFLLVFVVELLLKLSCMGLRMFLDFKGEDFWWNIFDVFIVGAGFMDLIIQWRLGVSAGGVATIFRLVRLLRIMRLFRIVRYLKQVYFIAYGLFVATQAVAQVSVVMAFVLFVSSVVLAKTIGAQAKDPSLHYLHEGFGSVSRSMLTLFELMAVPDLRVLEADGLLLSRPCLLGFLVLYIVFGSFGMIAILTGVISESMFEKNELRNEEAQAEREARLAKLTEHADAIFDTLECDAEGEADRSDVENIMPDIANMLKSYGVEYTEEDMVSMVNLMDTNHDGSVSKGEFTRAILFQTEGMRPMSLQEMHYDVTFCKHKLEKLTSLVENFVETFQATQYSHLPMAPGGARRSMKAQKAQILADPGQITPLPSTGAAGHEVVLNRLDAVDRVLGNLLDEQRLVLDEQKSVVEDLQKDLCNALRQQQQECFASLQQDLLSLAPLAASTPQACCLSPSGCDKVEVVAKVDTERQGGKESPNYAWSGVRSVFGAKSTKGR
mmetsp:Transcript_42280/g.107566  ORF Transcript_42280/g.107566 Transcript_42280/m.107566 type:complete len:573 (+) Transcript_42280:115-1833(+)